MGVGWDIMLYICCVTFMGVVYLEVRESRLSHEICSSEFPGEL